MEPSLAWRWRTPRLLMAVHMVMLPPLWPGTCDRTVTKDVASSFGPFCQVEPCLINEDVLMWVRPWHPAQRSSTVGKQNI